MLSLPGGLRIKISLGTLLSIALFGALVYPAFSVRNPDNVPVALGLAVTVGVALIISVLMHELAHALIARLAGARVDHIALNLLGGHTQYRAPHLSPLWSAAIALSGPAANALCAALAWLAFLTTTGEGNLALVVYLLATLNAGLALFNLIPGLPLDGGRALEAFATAITKQRWMGELIAGWAGRVLASVLILYIIFRLMPAAYGSSGILIAVIMISVALQLSQGASDAITRANYLRRSPQLRLEDVMIPVTVIAAQAPIADLQQAVSFPGSVLVYDGSSWFEVEKDALASVPREAWDHTPASAVATTLGPALVVTESDAMEVAQAAQHNGQSFTIIVVNEESQVRGMVPIRRG